MRAREKRYNMLEIECIFCDTKERERKKELL